MKVKLIEYKTNNEKLAEIQVVSNEALRLNKKAWSFDWLGLSKVEGSEIFSISLDQSPELVEGILMLTLFNDEMLFMNNIEVAPHNVDKHKRYENTAGVLLAFACMKSFEKGKGNYKGFLSFDSKTELIELYHKKYGATLAIGHKMYFDPDAGKELMKKYLRIKK